jgi:hypothetical protein
MALPGLALVENAAGSRPIRFARFARQAVQAWAEIAPRLHTSSDQQPLWLEFCKALECAAIAGDAKMARSSRRHTRSEPVQK